MIPIRSSSRHLTTCRSDLPWTLTFLHFELSFGFDGMDTWFFHFVFELSRGAVNKAFDIGACRFSLASSALRLQMYVMRICCSSLLNLFSIFFFSYSGGWFRPEYKQLRHFIFIALLWHSL